MTEATIYPGLLQKYPITSDQIDAAGLKVVLGELEKVLGARVPGAIVEFGCYTGTTSLFIRHLLNQFTSGDNLLNSSGQPAAAARDFHVYDSFAGLPAKSIQDASGAGTAFVAGELMASKRDFIKTFKHAGLKPPHIHKAWFKDLTDKDVPAQIAFAFLDGDFYQSIYDSLSLVWPRLTPGGVVVVDDYAREALPGVSRAVQAFFQKPNRQLPAAKLQTVQGRAVLTQN